MYNRGENPTMFEDVKNCGAGKFVSRGEWQHPDRVINSNEAIFVTDGTVYINEDGIRYELCKNDLLILEASHRHFGYKKSSDTSFFWVHWTGGPKIDSAVKKQKITDSYNLNLLLKQLMHYRAEREFGESLDYLTRLVLIELFSARENVGISRVAAEAAGWITANRDNAISAAQVAQHLGYNPDYLNRIFKTNYGKTLKEFIDCEKMKYIKELLISADLTLCEVSNASGFNEYKYFLKFFKYHEGITPTQFLKTYPKSHINTK